MALRSGFAGVRTLALAMLDGMSPTTPDPHLDALYIARIVYALRRVLIARQQVKICEAELRALVNERHG